MRSPLERDEGSALSEILDKNTGYSEESMLYKESDLVPGESTLEILRAVLKVVCRFCAFTVRKFDGVVKICSR